MPFGRIYHGAGLQADVAEFLAAQKVQGPPYTPDTDWLAVKHVDEFMSVQATGPDTFRVILASPLMGIDILQQLAFDGFVFEHGQLWHPGEIRTADYLLNHEPDPVGSPGFRIRDFNSTIIQPKIDALIWDLPWLDIDFVEVPAYFITLATSGPPTSWPAQSMLPDMVNMLNVNGTLIVPDPNPHPDIIWPAWFGNDPFKQAFINAVDPTGNSIRWIDCMEYHYWGGEVHCATNVLRKPRQEVREWWLLEP